MVAVARAARSAGRIAALAGLLGAGLLLSPATASATERGAQPAASPGKESPYARYAREHARTAEKKPGRVKPGSSLAHRPRGSARGGRH
jgi:2-keto-3-deoxy-6-phosphogluconate aldolase